MNIDAIRPRVIKKVCLKLLASLICKSLNKIKRLRTSYGSRLLKLLRE
jgi:hypothetical protein